MNDYFLQLREAILDGPVNTTAYYIFKYLGQGKTDLAEMEWRADGDKISRSSPYYLPIKKILGCRSHLNTQCANRACQ